MKGQCAVADMLDGMTETDREIAGMLLGDREGWSPEAVADALSSWYATVTESAVTEHRGGDCECR